MLIFKKSGVDWLVFQRRTGQRRVLISISVKHRGTILRVKSEKLKVKCRGRTLSILTAKVTTDDADSPGAAEPQPKVKCWESKKNIVVSS
jgi:hypothetical protein